MALGITSLTLTMGIPAFSEALSRQRVNTAIYLLSSDIAMARNTAISTRKQVVVCPRDPSQQRCRTDGNWKDGWLVFNDADHDQQPGSLADVLRSEDSPGNGHVQIVTSVGRPLLRYQPDGRSGGSNLTVRICVGVTEFGQVIVNNWGRVRTTRSGTTQPCSTRDAT